MIILILPVSFIAFIIALSLYNHFQFKLSDKLRQIEERDFGREFQKDWTDAFFTSQNIYFGEDRFLNHFTYKVLCERMQFNKKVFRAVISFLIIICLITVVIGFIAY